MSGAASLRLLAAAMAAIVPGCASRHHADYCPEYGHSPFLPQETEYSFAVPPSRSANHLHRVYKPLLDWLSAGQDFRFRFQTARSYSLFWQRVTAREFDFAALAPDDVLEAERFGYRVVVRSGDQDMAQGVVITGTDVPARRARDLKGRRWCFSSPGDLAGTMMVEYSLRERGLDLRRDARVSFVSSDESCAINVALGLADAGGVSVATWNSLHDRPDIRAAVKLLWATERLPGAAVVAGRRIPAGLREAVAARLVRLPESERKGLLSGTGFSAFRPATIASFDPIAEFLAQYRRSFGAAGKGRRR